MKYRDHPVDRWRNAFVAVVNQLDEALGKNAKVADAEDAAQRQGQLAATEPGFEVLVEGKGVSLTWQNLEEVRVNYYPMDGELLCSRSPCAQGGGGQFAFTKPSATQVVKLPANQAKLAMPLPDELAKRNVFVEVTAAGKTRAAAYFASAMDVKLTENF